MNRRNALKMLGVLVACLGGQAVPTKARGDDSSELTVDYLQGPYDYTFSAEGVRNIIIERKDKPDLVIPFKDIVKALEDA